MSRCPWPVWDSYHYRTGASSDKSTRTSQHMGCDSQCLKDNTFLHINQMALWPQSIARHRWNWKAWFGSLIISTQVSVEYSHWCHWNASESWKRWQQVWKYMVIMSDILQFAQISLSALISLALHTIWILGECKHWVMRDRTESSFAF